MPGNSSTRPFFKCDEILDETEVARRMLLLGELQAGLAHLKVYSVLARHRRLVLRYNDPGLSPSGPTDPALHVFASDGSTAKVRTDGMTYQFGDSQQFPVGDPAGAAAVICGKSVAMTT